MATSGPFISPAIMLEFYDYRVIGMLVNDTNTPDNAVQLLTDPVLANALSSASGMIEAAALRGGMYTALQLYELTDISLSWLQKLCADIAIWTLVIRRGLPIAEYPQTILALEQLAALETGALIFNVPAVITAGSAEDPTVFAEQIYSQSYTRDQIYFLPSRRFAAQQLP